MIMRFEVACLATVSILIMGAAPVQPRAGASRVVDDQGYRVRLDLGPQVLSIVIPDDRAYGQSSGATEAPISPTLPADSGGFVSGSMLAQKAKQFDDGLYAAVELAAQNGAGSFPGKSAMLRGFASRIASGARGPDFGNALVVLLAGCRQGRLAVSVPPDLESAVASAEREFLATPLRSKPLGFYTWSAALTDIYRQDRMLQTELKGPQGIVRVAEAIAADPGSKGSYEAYLSLVDHLTNPAGSLADLRGLLRALEANQPGNVPRDGVAIFPPSRSHEGDLVMKLYGNRPIPEGFLLVDEMIRRIRSGQIDLAPTAHSGWYDYQTWALVPLVIPERMPEAARLQLGDEYRKQLIELFKGVLALTRETHVKQLEIPAPGAAPPGGKPPVIIHIAPELAGEPLVSYYRRRAESYDFIRRSLLATFSATGLKAMHRQTATGAVAANLGDELDTMHALFLGASALTAHQLGMAVDGTASSGMAAFRSWAQTAGKDLDVGQDARMMVPIFYDRMRRKMKVWAFLGWSQRPVTITFARSPSYEITRDGRKVDAKEAPEVHFVPSFHSLAYPVMVEAYVSNLQDRDEFRKFCDTYKTRAAILEHLK